MQTDATPAEPTYVRPEAAVVRGQFEKWERRVKASYVREASAVAESQTRPHTPHMEVTRHEMNARLEAAEARVAASTESIRSDMGILRSEMTGLRSELIAQASIARSSADAFYAKAEAVLSEIHLANEKHKNAIYGIGYRVIAWTLGTLLAVGGIVLGAFRAYMTLQGG